MIKRLLHVRYRVSDLEKTVAFYKEVLGLKEIERLRSPRGSEIVFLRAPEGEGSWKSASSTLAARSASDTTSLILLSK
jgi:catechol 2,3-dioxygenase-like lactoylglutathione lyase family enzyme